MTSRRLANWFTRLFRPGFVAGFALSILGCGELSDDAAPDVVTETKPIINGTIVTNDLLGTPILRANDPGLGPDYDCSGTMIRKDWALTAHHCVTQGALGTGGTQIAAANLVGHIKGANSPWVPAVRIVRHDSLDVALVQFSAPVADANGQTFANLMYVSPNDWTVSGNVFVQGWGLRDITSCTPPGGTNMGGVVLASGSVKVDLMFNLSLARLIAPAGGTQIPWLGDSGSTPFWTVNSRRRPTGVTSACDCSSNPLQVTQCSATRSDAFRGWLQGIVGGGTTGGNISGLERMDGATSVIYAHTNGHVKALTIGGAPTSSWFLEDLTGPAPTAQVGYDTPSYVRADGSTVLLWGSANNHIIERRQTATGWVWKDLMDNGATAKYGANFSAYVRSDNVTAVVYRSSDDHIRELSLNPGASTWGAGDLTGITGGITGSRPIGYVRGDGISTVVYVDGLGHIQELTLWGTTWLRSDLTITTAAPTVVQGVRPYTRSDGYSIVLFRDSNQDIWELAMPPSGSWSKANLTSLFGCQKAFNDPYGYVRSDGVSAVVYKGTDAHVREISLNPNWVCNDLSGPAGGATVGLAPPYAFVGPDFFTHVVYRSTDNHVRELKVAGGGSWVAKDLTAAAGGLL